MVEFLKFPGGCELSLLYLSLLSHIRPFAVPMQKHKKGKPKKFFVSAIVRIVNYT